MRHVPIVVVAVLAAMVLTAVVVKLRAPAPHARGLAPVPSETATAIAASSASAPRGLGAGPPPDPSASTNGDAGTTTPPGPRLLHGGVRRTHRAEALAPMTAPTVVWSHDTGGPIEAQVTVSPDGQTLYVASLAGTLTALARADGAERWSLSLGDRAYATPAVAADGTIYAGSDAKKIVAISPEGKVKWSLETDGDADTGPAIADDGTVVFAAGRMAYGVSPTGDLRWRYAARRKIFTAPAIGDGGRVVFGSQDGSVYALSSDGHLAWSTALGADVDGAPAIADDGAIFVGTDGDEVVRLEPQDGHVGWRTKVGGYVRGPLSVARDGDVLAGVYGPAPRVVRLRAADGALRGDFRIQGTGAREFGVHGAPLEDAAGTLLFGTQDDGVYAVDDHGRLLWRFAAEGDVDAPVTLLDDGTVLVGSDDGRVRALHAGRP